MTVFWILLTIAMLIAVVVFALCRRSGCALHPWQFVSVEQTRAGLVMLTHCPACELRGAFIRQPHGWVDADDGRKASKDLSEWLERTARSKVDVPQ